MSPCTLTVVLLSVDIAGDNLILGGYDKRVCWFDLDLSTKPYRVIRYSTTYSGI